MSNPLLDPEMLALLTQSKRSVRAPFYAFTPGYLPGNKLPGGFTYSQSAGAGQSEETWVTNWATGTIARTNFVADTPKIGRAPNGVAGLRLRASWKNYLRSSEDFTAWTATGTSVATPNTDVSPDSSV